MDYVNIWILLILGLTTSNCVEAIGIATTTSILNSLQQNIDINERPSLTLDRPDDVTLMFYITGIRQISEIDSEVVYDLHFRYSWIEPRLQRAGGPEVIVVTPEVGKQYLWFPDMYCSNAHDTKIGEMTTTHSGVRIKRSGKIYVYAKMTLAAYCLMDLRRYPRDTQNCGFDVSSYIYTSSEIRLNVSSVHMGDNVRHSKGVRNFQVSNLDYSIVTNMYGPASFDKVQVRLTFTRVSSHYIALVYVPCVLLVVLSALVFWFPTTALSERALYGSVLLLAVVPIMVGSQLASPAVGYLKAMDVWVVAHFFFLAVAVLEVLLIHLLLGRMANRPQTDHIELVPNTDGSQGFTAVKFGLGKISPDVAEKIDLGLRIIYPAAYVVFNAVFWAAY